MKEPRRASATKRDRLEKHDQMLKRFRSSVRVSPWLWVQLLAGEKREEWREMTRGRRQKKRAWMWCVHTWDSSILRWAGQLNGLSALFWVREKANNVNTRKELPTTLESVSGVVKLTLGPSPQVIMSRKCFWQMVKECSLNTHAQK